ncbi:beta-1,3-galactosyltransferase GALT1 [Selaginella moellendorffii]|uniref:beta-1,3-galactosyltransferase GALT1 n=1 Tax=Selaginella moellendorffii TaxID=88036 RepID=UPI000D1CA3AC|nr:beta-1,3-galactosyltransferase GALT1 [Selaginella moellendorffii]|eukprot:XP_024518666.1 beta-1,3-galactosyltransferase GALT1 [Selaginella moellendorffii]
MQSSVVRIAGAIRGISIAAIVSFVSGALLLRLLMVEGPALRSLQLTWAAPVLRAAMAPTSASSAASASALEQLIPAPAPAPLPDPADTAAATTDVDTTELLVAMVSSIPPSSMQPVALWELFKPVMARRDLFAEARTKMTDAWNAWQQLLEFLRDAAASAATRKASSEERHCPYSVSWLNATDLSKGGRVVADIPCGLVLDSSITLVGAPAGVMGDFRIDLVGQSFPGERAEAPIILHHNIRLGGDQLSPRAVIVQNTWTAATDWADEERCPPPPASQQDLRTVDGLAMCAPQVGIRDSPANANASSSPPSKWPGGITQQHGKKPWFPYADGHPFAATVWAGWDGFHVTVDGKHVTSFEYRQNLEPWMVSSVRLEGSLLLTSLIANGLPTSEDQNTLRDLDRLKAPPLPPKGKALDMFIGVFSTGNNFERRMAVRRSWMQYELVRSGKIAVRFFVGLDQNQQVNVELWKEAVAYGDIQLLPFIDYYNLITLKTLAICIYATKIVKSRYVMKTDDDTFVRVDEVYASVRRTNRSEALLYGLIEGDSKPNRDYRSKWYITEEEWPLPRYPPWAHGPGYIFSRDIARFVVKRNEEMRLKLFKLEDVAMGAWIEEYGRVRKKNVSYASDANFLSDNCKDGYKIAHYQNPRQMICLWQHLEQGSGPLCCN